MAPPVIFIPNPLQSGRILTDAQLLRDILFVMQNIPGHYVKWNASEEMFELDPRHRVDARDASCIESLSLLGFYLRQINTFLEDKPWARH